MRALRPLALVATLVAAMPATAQVGTFLQDANLQRRANGLCALVGYTVVPDVTTGSLGIHEGATLDPDLRITSLGGGFTWSREAPLYLEGTAAYSHYNPSFATDGEFSDRLPATWKTQSLAGGVGWDFPITAELRFRPIVNASVGRLESSLSVAQREPAADPRALEFLREGRLNMAGGGVSFMLDYEDYRPEREIDAELRYSDVRLKSTSGTSQAVEGSAIARSASLWTRYRAPTGYTALDRPVRYVLEYAVTRFMGDLDGVLGFNVLNSFGVGLELDSSTRDIFVTRTRVVARYVVGNNVSGWSLGVAVSF